VLDTKYSARTKRGEAEVSGWAMVGERRVEIREHHRQRAYSETEIREGLLSAGLSVVEKIDFDPFLEGRGRNRGVKLVFVAAPAKSTS
jgi:hypothetical protein